MVAQYIAAYVAKKFFAGIAIVEVTAFAVVMCAVVTAPQKFPYPL
jgi:hypothetical protein